MAKQMIQSQVGSMLVLQSLVDQNVKKKWKQNKYLFTYLKIIIQID